MIFLKKNKMVDYYIELNKLVKINLKNVLYKNLFFMIFFGLYFFLGIIFYFIGFK